MKEKTTQDDLTWAQIVPHVDSALGELPEELRTPLILHYVLGRTQAEVAEELQLDQSSVSRRLKSGIETLRDRLGGLGVAVPAAILTALLAEKAARAAPPALMAALGKMAMAGVGKSLVADATAKAAAAGLVSLKVKLALVAAAAVTIGGLFAFTQLPRKEPSPDTRFAQTVVPEGVPAPQVAPEPPPVVETNQDKPAEPRPGTDLHGDLLPPFAKARLGTTRLRHGSAVDSIAFSPNGRLMASGGRDGRVRLWDAATGEKLFEDEGLGVAFSPDGKLLATGSDKGIIRIWDVGTRAGHMRIRGARRPVAFSPDGTRLVAESDHAGIIQVWDLREGAERRMLAGPEKETHNVALSPDGGMVAAAYWVGREPVVLWDVAIGEERLRIGGGERIFRSVAFSPDGRMLAAGSSDGEVCIWDVAAGTEVLLLQGDGEHSFLAVTFSPDGKTVAAGDVSRIYTWDVATGAEVLEIRDAGHALAFSPDGKLIAAGCGHGVVTLYDAETGLPAADRHHVSRVRSLAFSPDGKLVASACGFPEHTVHAWDPSTGEERLRLHVGRRVNTLAFSPDGRKLAAGTTEGLARMWVVATGDELVGVGEGEEVGHVAFSPDGKALALSDVTGRLSLWSAETGDKLRVLAPEGFESFAFSPDGKAIAAAAREPCRPGAPEGDSIRVWETATGKELVKIEGPGRTGSGHVLCNLDFSPDGRTLATTHTVHRGGPTHEIRLWNAATGEELRTIRGHRDYIKSIAFSPDGKMLASGGRERIVRLWDVATGRELARLPGHEFWVLALAFSPDGKLLASGGDTTALLWDVAESVAAHGVPRATSASAGGRWRGVLREIPHAEPAWRRELRWRLRHFVKAEFRHTRLSSALASLERQTGVRMVLDRAALERKLTSRVNFGLGEMTLRRSLEFLLRPRGLDFVSRGNDLYVSTVAGVAEERRRQIARGERPEWKSELRERLRRPFIYRYHVDRRISELAEDIERLTRIKVTVDPHVLGTRGGETVKLAGVRLENTTHEKAIERLLGLAGLAYGLRDGAIFVSTPEGLRRLPRAQPSRIRDDAPTPHAGKGQPSPGRAPPNGRSAEKATVPLVRPGPQKVTDIDSIELARNIWAIEKAYAAKGPKRLRELRRYLDYPHPLVRLIAARKLAVLRDEGALPQIEKLLALGREHHLAVAKMVIEAKGKDAAATTRLANDLLKQQTAGCTEVVSIWCELGWSSHLEEIDLFRKPNQRDSLPFFPGYGDILLRRELEKVPAQGREAWLFEKLIGFKTVWEYEAARRAISRMGRPAVPRAISHMEEVITAPLERFGPMRKRETCLSIGCFLLMSLPADERSLGFLEEQKEHFTHRWTKRSRATALRWLKAGVRYPYQYFRLFPPSHESFPLFIEDNARTRAWYGRQGATEAPAVPRGYRSLTDLRPLHEDKRVPATDRARELAAWLRQEVVNPRPTTRGAGGPITSGYVCLQIVKTMSFVAVPNRVKLSLAGKPLPESEEWFRAALAIAEEGDAQVRDWLTVALGMAGDRDCSARLIEIVREGGDGYLRAAAARALGDLGAHEAIPALEEALDDPFHVAINRGVGGDVGPLYPTRQAARGSLRRVYRATARVPSSVPGSTQRKKTINLLKGLTDKARPERVRAAIAALDNRPVYVPLSDEQLGVLTEVIERDNVLASGSAARVLGRCHVAHGGDRAQIVLRRFLEELRRPSAIGELHGTYLSPRVVALNAFLLAFSYIGVEAVPTLRAALKDADSKATRKWLHMALGICGDREAADEVRMIAKSDPDRYVRWVGIRAYARAAGKEAIPFLTSLLEDETTSEFGDSHGGAIYLIRGAAQGELTRLRRVSQ